jgi:glucan 1,3-beta-glucosidase
MGDFTVINVVTDYGAYGDGIHDDTAAINNALTAVPNGTSPPGAIGAIVYFPAGKYLGRVNTRSAALPRSARSG